MSDLPNRSVKNTNLINILSISTLLLAILSGILLSDKFFPQVNITPAGFYSTKQEVLNIMKSEGLKGLPSSDKLTEGELKGVVESLDDPYSQYLAKADNEKFQNDLNQRYEGIGVKFEQQKNDIVVNSVLSGGSAKDAGVQKGDILKKVDGRDVSGTNLNDVATKIRGPRDTQISVEFNRNGQIQSYNLTRRSISADLVVFDIKNDFGIITISSFGDGVDQKIQAIASQIKANSNIKKIIIDLRGDTGGLLDQCIQLISYFVDSNQVVVQEKTRFETTTQKSSIKNPSLKDYPLMILVDKNSASASEIMAGAIRDLRGVKLVGQKTFGKGVVQKLYTLKNGDSLKLTVASWLTPKGYEIDKKGLDPDIKVNENDDSLEVAMKSF